MKLKHKALRGLSPKAKLLVAKITNIVTSTGEAKEYIARCRLDELTRTNQ